jgi:hypothetical protein
VHEPAAQAGVASESRRALGDEYRENGAIKWGFLGVYVKTAYVSSTPGRADVSVVTTADVMRRRGKRASCDSY